MRRKILGQPFIDYSLRLRNKAFERARRQVCYQRSPCRAAELGDWKKLKTKLTLT
jgi:hypothetical protein